MDKIYYNGGKMNILIFSDFHEENFTYNDLLKIEIDPDLMLFLGDIPTETLFSLVTTFPNNIFWDFGKP